MSSGRRCQRALGFCPMPYEIFYTEESEAALLALPAKAQGQIRKKVEALRHWAGDIKKLEGVENAYRLRSGDYRIIFERTGSIIVIFKISNRKDAYG
jgi:mRNA-degrading endonuclease RelE of RelBE toxin-antitoxin system